MIITQNGEAKAVVQDVYSYEKTQETLAMLKLIAMARRDIDEGQTRPAHEVLKEIRSELIKRR